MIANRNDLREYLNSDNQWLIPRKTKDKVIEKIGAYPAGTFRKYLKLLRNQEYYINTANGNRLKWLLSVIYEGRKNRLGMKLGIEIGPNCFGRGLNLYHSNVVINPAVRVGDNCSLHGANCIGNNGLTDGVPKLGNNVDVGYGAIIIGDITIADGVKIGANAVVNRSVTEPGCTVAGVPARIVKSRQG
jgi:serine O-acetyltransferase